MTSAAAPAEAWARVTEAVAFAVERIESDADPLGEREPADGHQYVVRILTAVSESMRCSPSTRPRPTFLPMLESVRYLGASGPDIDYDVAIVRPVSAHRISGHRGGATFVGIAVYGHAGERGASGIVASVDVDDPGPARRHVRLRVRPSRGGAGDRAPVLPRSGHPGTRRLEHRSASARQPGPRPRPRRDRPTAGHDGPDRQRGPVAALERPAQPALEPRSDEPRPTSSSARPPATSWPPSPTPTSSTRSAGGASPRTRRW